MKLTCASYRNANYQCLKHAISSAIVCGSCLLPVILTPRLVVWLAPEAPQFPLVLQLQLKQVVRQSSKATQPTGGDPAILRLVLPCSQSAMVNSMFKGFERCDGGCGQLLKFTSTAAYVLVSIVPLAETYERGTAYDGRSSHMFSAKEVAPSSRDIQDLLVPPSSKIFRLIWLTIATRCQLMAGNAQQRCLRLSMSSCITVAITVKFVNILTRL